MSVKGIHLEKFGPAVLGLFVAALYYFFCPPHKMPDTMKDVLSAVVNVGAILVGFLSTAWSILVSMENKRVIALLKSAGYHKHLFDYLTSSIGWLFVLTLYSATGLFFDFKTPHAWHRIGFTVWLFLVVVALCCCWRIIRVFSMLLRFDDSQN